jgi:DNA (cytosine-5)-methyltransferase 1
MELLTKKLIDTNYFGKGDLIFKGKNSFEKLNVLDLFSGCGGISLGFYSTGKFNIAGAIDFDDAAIKTFKLNFPEALCTLGDISTQNPKSFENHKIDVIVGGPPCQGFSSLNRHYKDLKNDPRNKLFYEFLRYVDYLRPKAILIENVPQILTQNNGEAKIAIVNMLNELGYNVIYFIANATEFGVPQKRRRAIFIATLKSISTISIRDIDKYKSSRIVTVKDAIMDLYQLESSYSGSNIDVYEYPKSKKPNKYIKHIVFKESKYIFNHRIFYSTEKVINRMKFVPQGGNWKNVPENLLPSVRSNRHSNYLKRLHEDLPSITIDTGHSVYYHPIFNRNPTVRESARLQSFSDNFLFYGTFGQQLKQVGNAVPPLLAKNLAELIWEKIK